MYDLDADEKVFKTLIVGAPIITYEEAFNWSRRVEPRNAELVIGELIAVEQKLLKVCCCRLIFVPCKTNL